MARPRGNPNWVKGKSGNPSGKKKDALAKDEVRPGVVRVDDWVAALSGIGSSQFDKRTGISFETPTLVDSVTAQLIWRGNDLGARIVETKPNEMLREGFELCIGAESEEGDEETDSEVPEGPEQKAAKQFQRQDAADKQHKKAAEEVTAAWEDMGLVPAIWQALCYENAYGGGAVLLGAQDGSTDLSKPLKPERVREFKWVTVLEAKEIQPIIWYTNPLAANYGKPEVYEISPTTPGQGRKSVPTQTNKVHESRLLVFPGIRVSRQQVGEFSYFGDSVFTRCYPVLRDFGVSWASASIMVHDFAQAVYKIKNLNQLFQIGDSTILRDRMRAVELSRSTARAILIDSEEEFERKQTPVSGLPELLDRFATRLAAAADMPLTLLMGQSPGGLNATGESDIRFFYDRIAAAQTQRLRPVLEKVIRLLFKANGFAEPEKWYIEFKPLWQPTQKELIETRKMQAEIDQIYIANGVLSPEEVVASRFGGDEFSFETVVDFDGRAALEPMVDPPAKTEQQIEQETHERDLAMKTLEAKQGAFKGKGDE